MANNGLNLGMRLGLTACFACGACQSGNQAQKTSKTPHAMTHTTADTGEKSLVSGGGYQIGDTEVDRELARKNEAVRQLYVTPARRKMLADALLTVTLVSEEAKRAGYEDHPEVRQRTKRTLEKALIKNLERDGKLKPAPITKAQLQAAYRKEYAAQSGKTPVPFSDVREQLENRLIAKARDARLANYVAQLRRTATVEIDQKNWAALVKESAAKDAAIKDLENAK